ncbi:acyl-CoA dehydrogenase family protein [Actinoplanes sp. NPDC049681]|uniref:acyl-CoA dehydrogenase family protein n=1 Tax=Actinoplanes sp. NPDC049681 TaxID=3363905 RepID=UPI0037947E36
MDFDWNPRQRAAQSAVRDAVRDAFGEPPDRRPQESFFTREEWRTLGDLGLLGLCLPTEYGGGGLGALETAGLVEAFGRACDRTGLVFAASAHLFACCVPISEFGSDTLRKRLLPGLASGELVAGNAMTETDAGSDVSRLATVAEPTEGGWLLNGEKSFVSNGPAADVFVTYAMTDPAAGHLGVTGFVVERGAPGLSVGEPFDKLGLAACPAGGLTFNQCFVPDENVLGGEGAGGAVFQHSMGWERACLFAGYLGLMDRLIEQCVVHVRSRRQFGRRLADFQGVANRLVDMKMRAESARLLLYRACWSMDQGADSVLQVALSKLAVSEGALAAALDAVRVFGARGYRSDFGIATYLRDAIPSTIFSGTSDIQRLLIAKEMGL